MKSVRAATLVLVGVATSSLLYGCVSSSPRGTGETGPEATAHLATTMAATGTINPAAIPLGDGKVSTSAKVGYVDSCVTHFSTSGGGSFASPWINTSKKTWDSLTKPHVEGSVSWSSAHFSVTTKGSERVVTGNDLPIGHTTGVFPIRTTDPAYAYDHNPNSIKAQTISWSLPLNPKAATKPKCLGLGPVGVLDDGVYLYDALDGEGRDAVAHEVLDNCDEHPQQADELHHHDVPSCILDKAKGRSTLVGYAADGYGIYVERTSNGALLTDSALDACHGRTSSVLWNGKVQDVYHYDATVEYPYVIGCYRGTPTSKAGP
jgi:hypothetical protein